MSVAPSSGSSAPAAPVSQDAGLRFLQNLIAELKEHGVPFALLHHGDDLKKLIASDVDLVLGEHPTAHLARIVSDVAEAHGFALINALHYEVPDGYYFIVGDTRGDGIFVHLDCMHDPYGVNRYFLTSRYLLATTASGGTWPAPGATAAAVYLLIKRCIKSRVSGDQLAELRAAVAADPGKVAAELGRVTGLHGEREIEDFVAASTEEGARKALALLGGRLRSALWRHHPLRMTAGQVLQAMRQLGRILRPTGFFLVVVGPDGCGKSTVTTELLARMGRGFRQVHRFHWRPGVLPKLGGTSAAAANEPQDSAPPKESRYRGPVSWLRFAYYSADFIAGYWLRLYPWRARTGLVVGERYFVDVMVNPARYGFAVPRWLLRLTRWVVPKPDLTVLLTNSPAVIHQRKPELSVAAIGHQLQALEAELPYWGNHVHVVTDVPPDQVASRIMGAIGAACSQRTRRRLGLDP